MNFIQNYNDLAKREERKIILDLIEAAYDSIDPDNLLSKNFRLSDNKLVIQSETVDLTNFDNIYLLGFGKGSAKNSSIVERVLGEKLTRGFVIDLIDEKFSKVEFTKGTHPLPSQTNLEFTKKVLEEYKNLGERDLVLVITCGGGSSLLVQPRELELDNLFETNKKLLESGANITEMNIVRKHLSKVKGGGLAESLFPATVKNLVFSDVPGNDLSTIASGPLVFDKSTVSEAMKVIEKYHLGISKDLLHETPKEAKFFENVSNILVLSNKTALDAMEEKAKALGKKVKVYSDTFQSEAKTAGKKLIDVCEEDSILLAGGETTVKVTGKGQGGRNQEVVLGALKELGNDITIASFATDGWDNVEVAGAIGDSLTLKKAQEAGIDPNNYLIDNDSLAFFKTVGDAIVTGRLPTNVSDLMIVYKK